MAETDAPAAKRQRTADAEDGKHTEMPVLYSYWRSSCSWRVRLALALKGVEYETRAVHLIKDGGEQHKEEYKKLNPNEEVPTLVINGHTLTQSMAIMEYLEELYPDRRSLLPKDPAARAQVRALCHTIAADTQPVQNLRVLQYVMRTFATDETKDKVKVEWGKHWITRGFRALEAQMRATADTYSVGNEVTMADLCLVPQVYNGGRFGVDMSEFPTISKVHENLVKLPELRPAHPDEQPDKPTEA